MKTMEILNIGRTKVKAAFSVTKGAWSVSASTVFSPGEEIVAWHEDAKEPAAVFPPTFDGMRDAIAFVEREIAAGNG